MISRFKHTGQKHRPDIRPYLTVLIIARQLTCCFESFVYDSDGLINSMITVVPFPAPGL